MKAATKIHFNISNAGVNALTSVLGESLCGFASRLLEKSGKTAGSHPLGSSSPHPHVDMLEEKTTTNCLNKEGCHFIECLRKELKAARRAKPEALQGECNLGRILAAIDRDGPAWKRRQFMLNAKWKVRVSNPMDVFRLHCADLVQCASAG